MQVKQIQERLSGNEAVAVAMRQMRPDVVAAFPITPSTEIPQYFSSFVAEGAVDTEFIPVESEHSAMSACIGAQAAGGRAMTATSANGLALMWEMLYVTAALRLPVLMACVNRALPGPLNIHNDHSDSMGARDSGWIQLYSENAQEAYDQMMLGIRTGEHPEVLLPVMVCQDGFITSHAIENIDLLPDEAVRSYIGEYAPPFRLLDPDRPVSIGPLDLQDHYFEHKRSQAEGMRRAMKAYLASAQEFERMTGRNYGFFEAYRLEDAEVGIVVLNSTAGTVKVVVDELRETGKKVGCLKIRVFRPFPGAEAAKALSGLKAVAVLDKADGLNAAGGPLFTEIAASLYAAGVTGPKLVNMVYGLGGRDTGISDIEQVFGHLLYVAESGTNNEVYHYLGVRD